RRETFGKRADPLRPMRSSVHRVAAFGVPGVSPREDATVGASRCLLPLGFRWQPAADPLTVRRGFREPGSAYRIVSRRPPERRGRPGGAGRFDEFLILPPRHFGLVDEKRREIYAPLRALALVVASHDEFALGDSDDHRGVPNAPVFVVSLGVLA